MTRPRRGADVYSMDMTPTGSNIYSGNTSKKVAQSGNY